MIGPFGRQGPAATLRQQCPQMTQRRCTAAAVTVSVTIRGESITCRLERLSVELVTGRTEVTTGMVSFVPLRVISHSSREDEGVAEGEVDEQATSGRSGGAPSGGDFLKAACSLCSEGSNLRS